MLTSMNTLFNISTYETNEAKLLENIRNDWSFMVNLDKIYNSNGTWIVDLLKWSWANIKCRIQWDGTFLLEWDNWSVAWNDGIEDNCNVIIIWQILQDEFHTQIILKMMM
jgi:hypothetical protein